MRLAFVGVKRKYKDLPPDYRDAFNKYHLELPYYYAQSSNDVVISTVDYEDRGVPVGSGWLECRLESNLKNDADVTVHWRKWFPELAGNGINVINCQDHSFSNEWKRDVILAFRSGKLYGITCFPGWHKRNLFKELDEEIPEDRLIDGLTLGVDCTIYRPTNKKKHQLLWSSDPGRGLVDCMRMFVELYRRDQMFHLNVCYPDYVQYPVEIRHPGVTVHGSIPNGERLWQLFNECGFLPYTSRFREPSSRAHRQSQAAGCVVLYPKNMGTPSELITSGENGFVLDIDDVKGWADTIFDLSMDQQAYDNISIKARELALSEDWSVQAFRFNDYFGRILGK